MAPAHPPAPQRRQLLLHGASYSARTAAPAPPPTPRSLEKCCGARGNAAEPGEVRRSLEKCGGVWSSGNA